MVFSKSNTIFTNMIKSDYSVVAIMSGTSLDGVDIIYATYSIDKAWNFTIHNSETVKYPKDWKFILSRLVNRSLDELEVIDQAYSKFLASLILDFIKKNKIEAIDFLASHGHTALHRPEKGLTYQIGNKQILANSINKKVICDFRIQDVKHGGQGAPLVPIGDRILFSDYNYCLNLGGFANISFEDNDERVAFDICPVNIVLNYYIAKLGLEYDDKGQFAAKGDIHEELLVQLNSLNFYAETPPKSLGLEWVELQIFPLIDSYNLQIEVILRTFVEHIAIQVSRNVGGKDLNVLVTGGGVYNTFLMSRINTLSGAAMITPNKEIIEYKEALVFGLLGILRDRNEVNCLKSVTGAIMDHSSGTILFPNV